MPYTCEVCGAVTEAKYGSGRFCRSECAKKYSSLVALEKRTAKLGRSAEREASPVTVEQIVLHATAAPSTAANPAFTAEQIRTVTPPTIAVPAAKPSQLLATSYNWEEQARASKPAPTPVIVNASLPETETVSVNVYVQYQKRARTREQMFKRMDNNMEVIRAEIARQFHPRYDLWKI